MCLYINKDEFETFLDMKDSMGNDRSRRNETALALERRNAPFFLKTEEMRGEKG